jgi:predicted amidohydrolase
MKTAVIQLAATGSKEKNIQNALALVHEAIAKKARFVLLPEVFHFRGKAGSQEEFRDAAELIPGASTAPFMDAAKTHRVAILAGSICEKIPGERKIYNTSVLIDPAGHIAARYRKIHLFDATIGKTEIMESRIFRAGRKKVTAKVGRWHIGLSICYDVRFPELFRAYARAGAEILCVPSAFTKTTGQAHWETLLRARAIENFCYVLAPNQIGKDARGIARYGNSMIVDPWGKILTRASGDREEIIYSELDKNFLRARRKVLV